jgi:hypothetical protein
MTKGHSGNMCVSILGSMPAAGSSREKSRRALVSQCRGHLRCSSAHIKIHNFHH